MGTFNLFRFYFRLFSSCGWLNRFYIDWSILGFYWHDDPQDQVGPEAECTGDQQDDEKQPYDRGIQAEEITQTSTYASQHFICGAAV